MAEIKKDYSYSDEYQLLYDELEKTNFKININEPNFMIIKSDGYPEYNRYGNWNKLIKKIVSI